MWPPSANIVVNGMQCTTTLLSMSSANVALVQYPQMQKQTTLPAMIKHKHALENMFLKNRLNCARPVHLSYSKPDSTSRDLRSLSQQAVLLYHNNFAETVWQESAAVKTGTIGPCPLLRMADFVGYDEDTRPSPSARVEQSLDLHLFF